MDLKLQFRRILHCRAYYKTVLVMKLIVLLLTITIIQVSAATFAQKITLNKSGAPLRQIMDDIRAQSGYDFLYNNKLLKDASPVTIHVKDASIEEVLQICFSNQPFSYKIEDKAILLKKKEPPVSAIILPEVNLKISGKIVDEKSLPLPGATVTEKGTKNAVAANSNGEFTINVNNGSAVLVISSIGYEVKEVLASTAVNTTIALVPSQKKLTEVVVTAYGLVKKVDLTDAVSSIDGKALQNRPLRSLADGLIGLSPGLNVSIPSGAPEVTPSLNIRGFTGLNTSGAPLILVDGVERPIQDVNPNDVESISVLKDGASSVVYGSRAPYGIILITTKNGSSGKVAVNYNSNYKFSSSAMLPQPLASYDWANLQNQLNLSAPDGTGTKLFTDLTIAQMKAWAAGDFNNPVFAGIDKKYVLNGSFPDPTSNSGYSKYTSFANDDYLDAYFNRTVPSMQQNLNFSGGSEHSNYYVSLGYNNTDGIIKNFDNYNKEYSVLSKLNIKAANWLDLNASLNYVRSGYQEPNVRGGGIDYFTLFSVFGREFYNYPLTNPDNPAYYNSLVSLGTDQGLGGVVTSNKNDLTFTGGFTLKPIEGLNITGSYTFRNNSFKNETSQKIIYQYNHDGTTSPGLRTANTSGESKTYGGQDYMFSKIAADYTKTVAHDHHFFLQVGAQAEQNNFSQLSGSGQALFAQDVVTSISTTAGPYAATDQIYNWTTLGYYGVFTYDFKEKYLLKLAARTDASSRFSPSARWGSFPAISGAWNVAKEDFWKGIKNLVSEFKPRVSWSKSGDLASAGATNYYTYLPAIPFQNSTQTLLGGNFTTYASPTGLVSSTLTWAKPTMLDFGADISALNDRLTITYDWYQRTVYDQAGPPKVLPQVLGTTAPATNNTVTETRGYEFRIGWNDKFNLAGKRADYGLSFSLSDYIGYVVKYANDGSGARGQYIPGQEFGVNYVYKSAGVVQNTSQLKNRVLNQTYTYPGYLTYGDLNGDGVIDGGSGNYWYGQGDLTTDGFNYPRKSYSIMPSFAWNNFNISAIFEGVMQWKMFVNDPMVFGSNGNQFFAPFYKQTSVLGYWTPNNTNAFYPAINQVGANILPNDQYILNLAHLRVRNVTIGYNLPKNWIEKINLKKVNVFLSGENLGFIYSKSFVKFDPDLLSTIGTAGSGYPPMRSFSFGLNASL
jgi:TonB-linked SusC/RagA family outer membrane protein